MIIFENALTIVCDGCVLTIKATAGGILALAK